MKTMIALAAFLALSAFALPSGDRHAAGLTIAAVPAKITEQTIMSSWTTKGTTHEVTTDRDQGPPPESCDTWAVRHHTALKAMQKVFPPDAYSEWTGIYGGGDAIGSIPKVQTLGGLSPVHVWWASDYSIHRVSFAPYPGETLLEYQNRVQDGILAAWLYLQ